MALSFGLGCPKSNWSKNEAAVAVTLLWESKWGFLVDTLQPLLGCLTLAHHVWDLGFLFCAWAIQWKHCILAGHLSLLRCLPHERKDKDVVDNCQRSLRWFACHAARIGPLFAEWGRDCRRDNKLEWDQRVLCILAHADAGWCNICWCRWWRRYLAGLHGWVMTRFGV